MRNYLFLVVFLPMPLLSVFMPWAGILIWGWISLVSPHRFLTGEIGNQSYNLIIAICVIAGTILARGRGYSIRLNFILFMQLYFIFAIVLSSYFSHLPPVSFAKYQDFVNVLVYTIILQMFLINRFRIEMIVLLVVLCIGSYGLQGGALFILSGGGHEFSGPGRSPIGDRNHLAIAIAMTIPLINYFRENFTERILRLGCAGLMFFSVLAVVGTGSRGGFVALAVVGITMIWRSRQKVIMTLFAGLVGMLVVVLAPDEWKSRIASIDTASEEDKSFRNRLYSWEVYAIAGLQNPFTGAGIYALQRGRVFFQYAPYEGTFERATERAWAAHSIYFQVLGEMGVVAFLAYLLTAAVTWIYCSRIIKKSEYTTDRVWCASLARAVQVSLLAFLVGGATVSLAFYDVYWILVVIVAGLKQLVDSRIDESAEVDRAKRVQRTKLVPG